MIVKCPICGTQFEQKTYRHIYCCRKCFKKGYRKKMKESQNPLFTCPNCGKSVKLDFSPIQKFKKWRAFSCSCGYRPYALIKKSLVK